MISKIKLLLISLISFSSLSLFGCPSPNNFQPVPIPGTVNLEKSTIKTSEKISLNVILKTPTTHQYAYSFAADRGSIENSNNKDSKATYTAPSVGGDDTIRVVIFDITDNINLPAINKTIVIN